MKNKKNKKLGYKFFWAYLIVCGLFAFATSVSYLSMAFLHGIESGGWFIFYMRVSLISLTFFVSTLLFILSKIFAWDRVYKIAYYTHVVSIGLNIIYWTQYMIGRYSFDRFNFIPTYLILVGLYLLELRYFRKRHHLQPTQAEANVEEEEK